MTQPLLNFTGDLDPHGFAVSPSVHVEARETSALAAVENAQSGRKASQCAQILALLKAAGEIGLSDLELHRATGLPRASICARRGFDLRSLIEPAGRYVDPGTRRSYVRWRVKGEREVA